MGYKPSKRADWWLVVMKKALAQNPNLLRTLIGLSLTLIFMLSYAVYGATVSPSVYIYQTEPTVDVYEASVADQNIERTYDPEENTTTWAWQVIADDSNLTWVNVTATDLAPGAVLRVTNVAKLYSHELLGNTYNLQNPLEEEFSCADLCDYASVHERTSEEGGTIEFHALTSVDPARRSNGSVFAADLAEAEQKSRAAIEYKHSPSILRIEIIEEGELVWSTNPDTGEADWKPVTKTWTVYNKLIYKITVDTTDATDERTTDHKQSIVTERSEERRVGKECRSRWSPYH